jgi:hypothetical protein
MNRRTSGDTDRHFNLAFSETKLRQIDSLCTANYNPIIHNSVRTDRDEEYAVALLTANRGNENG